VNKESITILDDAEKTVLHRNFAWLIKESGAQITTLAKTLDISYGTLYNILKPNENPTLTTLLKISKYFNVNLDELIHSDLSLGAQKDFTPSLKIEFADEEALDTLEIMSSEEKEPVILNYLTGNPNDYFAKTANNSSTLPLFPAGTILVFKKQTTFNDGDIVLVSLNGTPPVERRIMLDGNKIYFSTINPDIGKPEHHTDFKILGILVKAICNG